MVYNFFDKKSKEIGIKSMPNQQLANEIYKPITRKLFLKRVYSSFKDDVLGVDLADMQLISKHNKGTTIPNAFQSILNNSKRKPSKI